MQFRERIIIHFQSFLIQNNLRSSRYLMEFKKIINHLKIQEKMQKIQYKIIKIIKKFLISSFQTFLPSNKQLFPLVLVLLNSLLKLNKNLYIPFSKRFISNLHHQLIHYIDSLGPMSIIQNVLWLMLKIIKGAYNKNEAFRNIMNSGMVWTFLNHKQSNLVIRNGIKLLLMMMINFQQTFMQLMIYLSKILQKHQDPTATTYLIMQTLAEVELKKSVVNQSLSALVQQCLQQYLIRQQINIRERVLHFNIITIRLQSLASQKCPHDKMVSTMKNIIQDFDVKYLPLSDKILKVVQTLSPNLQAMKRILKCTLLFVHKNPIARSIFVHYYQLLNKTQLINILAGSLPQDLYILLNNDLEVSNCLKIVICLKVSVQKKGLQQIFQYALKDVLEKLWKNKVIYQEIPNILELWQMLEDLFSENEELLGN